jgi:hypothetical protein
MKTNYSLTKIKLERLNPDTQENMAMYCALNKAGRGYMGSDATDKAKVIRVLDQVIDNLDCLFTHLCENPTICYRVGSVGGDQGRKRKALPLPSHRQLRSRAS